MKQTIENAAPADMPTPDADLLRAAQNGSREAEEELIVRYTFLVRACARPYYLIGGAFDDLTQEGFLGLLKAIRDYDPEKQASFRTFAEFCVRNRLVSAVRAANRDKHQPLNRYVSTSLSAGDDAPDAVLYPGRELNPETLIIWREDIGELTKRWKVLLSGLEAEILGHYLEGLSYREIAAITHKSPKSVDNAVQRARQKLAHLKR